MSEENVEIVRLIYEAANRGDFEPARELLHREAEMHQPAEFPDAMSNYGREEFERGVALWSAEWAQVRFDVRAIRELADGRVLMEITLPGRGKRSGAELEQKRNSHALSGPAGPLASASADQPPLRSQD